MSLDQGYDRVPPICRQDLPGGRGDRLLRGKNLRWLDKYRKLGYTFSRNGHIQVRDPAGLLVTSISCTGSDSEHHKSKTQLRRHERNRNRAHT
jgi:hypothetical protein